MQIDTMSAGSIRSGSADNRTLIAEMLDLRGKKQERLWAMAREVRDSRFGRTAVLRGVIEITNTCVKSCHYCPMRIENPIKRYFRRPSEILDSVEAVRDAGIGVVFFQGGEAPATTRVLEALIPRVRALYDDNVEVLLCVGDKPKTELERLKTAGADSYILKQETMDPVLHAKLREVDLSTRIDCLKALIDCGYRVGVGTIVGLPGQTHASLIDEALLMQRIGAHMISASPFIPALDTPLKDAPPGDLNLTLNLIAVFRLLYPGALIPTVSALERLTPGGQQMGLQAGANVITVNYTPEQDRSKYSIYGSDRFVVRFQHAAETLNSAGLEPLLGEKAYSFWT